MNRIGPLLTSLQPIPIKTNINTILKLPVAPDRKIITMIWRTKRNQ
jgi:hypothetical protein